MKRVLIVSLILLVFLPCVMWAVEVPESQAPQKQDSPPTLSLAEDMGEAMRREVDRVGEEIQQQAISLFERSPLGWDENTLVALYEFALSLPLRLPVGWQEANCILPFLRC